MHIATAYLPYEVFASSDRGDLPLPRVFIAPQRYIQDRGVLKSIGRYLSLVKATRVALLMSERGGRGEGVTLRDAVRAAGIACVDRIFKGECSVEEITRHAEALAHQGIDCVIAAGGGKCIDTGKGVAFRLGKMVAMGTLAQLMLEARPDETAKVAEFFATVGLPIRLGQLSLAAGDSRALDVLVEGTLAFPFIANMPQPVTAPLVRAAILDAHRIGLSVTERIGDAAYRRLH